MKMLPVKVIGIGAAGNKASIKLIEDEVMGIGNVLLLNSTLKDVPTAYKEYAIEFKGVNKGCAKDRTLANQMVMDNLRNGDINLDGFLSPEDKMVIIVNSAEGGTGCGTATVIANYFKEVLGVTVHMFVFGGFEEDARGLKNTVDYFTELYPSYIVQGISNKKFLAECNGNKIKAEQAANAEFSKRISILLGKGIIESETNIDAIDLLTLTTTPGFMTIEHGPLGKLKNVEAFNKAVSDIIDNSKSFDFTAKCERLGVILNIREKTRDSIDYFFNVIKEKLGAPNDAIFFHLQDVHEEEYIQIIAAGMKMPTADIQEVYDELVDRMNKADRSKDDFFGMKFDTASDMFDRGSKTLSGAEVQKNKAAFFGVKGKFQNTKVSEEL